MRAEKGIKQIPQAILNSGFWILNSYVPHCRKDCFLARIAIIVLAVFTVSGACGNSKPSEIRPAAVPGKFYPADPAKLRLAIQQFLQDSKEVSVEKPVALVVPHAGYIYSGQISADAYRQVMGRAYDTIVVLGTNHTTGGFRGISLGDYSAFRTPLGDVPVDQDIIAALIAEDKDCTRSRAVHIGEHSIEVQLPFLQVLFPKAKIVPAVIHPADPKMCVRFAETLARILKNRQALIVVSSDLSHYPNYRDASRADRQTLEAIAGMDTTRIASVLRMLDAPNLDTRACGEAAILAGITAAKALGATRAVVAGYANSGDIPVGDRSGTVGYGAVVLAPGTHPGNTEILTRRAGLSAASPLNKAEKKALLSFARETILRYITTQTVPLPRKLPPRMDFPQGAFVTLKKAGELRGCIGHIPPDMELGQTVGAMALQAAFNDPRFDPVEPGELNRLEIEISVLTPMRPIAGPDEIVVGRDGVVLSKSGSSAVFLPQVAPENRWNRSEMLDRLCTKAGLGAGCWKHGAKFQVFQAEVFSEHEYR
jgi:hypothetical protein